MIGTHCHTNLDLHYHERWPENLVARPMVGDYIKSALDVGGTRLELVVVRCIWIGEAAMDVELHLPPHRFCNISEFNEWDRERAR